MRALVWAGVAIVLWGYAVAGSAAPLEVYGRLPSVERLEISPDGKLLAMVVTSGGLRTLAVTRIADSKIVDQSVVGQSKVRALSWAGTRNLLVTISKTATAAGLENGPEEWNFAYDYNIESKKTWPLLSDAVVDRGSGWRITGPAGMNVVSRPPVVRLVDGKPVIFLTGFTFHSNQGLLTLFRTEIDSGVSEVVTTGEQDTRSLLLGEHGEVVAQSAYDQLKGRWAIKLRDGAAWHETGVTSAPVDTPSMIGLGRDGRSVLVRRNISEGVSSVVEVSPDSKWSGPIIPDGDPADVVFDPVRRNMIGYGSLVGDDMTYTFFDQEEQKAWNGIVRAFPGQRVTPVSWSDDRQKLILRVDSPQEGPAFALFDRSKRTAAWLGSEYVSLTPDDISPVRAIAFKAQDGLQLTGYLTVPRGREEKNLPLVVFPHGGPAARDVPGFNWWAQAMASRGYAVLQVNFRGSDGLGWGLMKAGFGEWGRKMQTDLSDGVRYLGAAGVVDPKRVCIVGASYGGYAALAGATLETGVYRCAAAYGGISDLRRIMNYDERQYGDGALRYWNRFMGAKGSGDPILTNYSPVKQAAHATIPILLVHGKDDTVVPLIQSQAMADALRKAGKPVELVVLKGEDHWLTNGETRLAMLQAVVDFLEKNNPPR